MRICFSVAFSEMFLIVYDFDVTHFSSATGLAWTVAIKMIKMELKLLTNIGTLLMNKNET